MSAGCSGRGNGPLGPVWPESPPGPSRRRHPPSWARGMVGIRMASTLAAPAGDRRPGRVRSRRAASGRPGRGGAAGLHLQRRTLRRGEAGGISADAAEQESGLLHHHYPCLASMGIDTDFGDTLMHVSGNLMRDVVTEQVRLFKTVRYVVPGTSANRYRRAAMIGRAERPGDERGVSDPRLSGRPCDHEVGLRVSSLRAGCARVRIHGLPHQALA